MDVVGVCLALSKVNKRVICESYLSHVAKDGFCSETFLGTQQWSGGEVEISSLSWFSRSTRLSEAQHCQGRN